MKFLVSYTIIMLLLTTIVGNILKFKDFKLDLKIKNFFLKDNLRFLKTSMKHITSMGDCNFTYYNITDFLLCCL